MCFTVAILRNNVLMTTEQYYAELPVKPLKQDFKQDFNHYYFVNGFSHPQLNVIKHDEIASYEWGLIPFWVKSLDYANEIRNRTLNAKGETIFEKPSYRKSIANQRCILPVSGFYEWKDVSGIKVPYFIFSTEEKLFSIGAIFDKWVNQETGDIRTTFSIVTTPANSLMEEIHNTKKRMPLIIRRANALQWLDPDLSAPDIKELIMPCSTSFLGAYTISKDANNSKTNRNIPEIQDQVIYRDLSESNKPNLLF